MCWTTLCLVKPFGCLPFILWECQFLRGMCDVSQIVLPSSDHAIYLHLLGVSCHLQALKNARFSPGLLHGLFIQCEILFLLFLTVTGSCIYSKIISYMFIHFVQLWPTPLDWKLPKDRDQSCSVLR